MKNKIFCRCRLFTSSSGYGLQKNLPLDFFSYPLNPLRTFPHNFLQGCVIIAFHLRQAQASCPFRLQFTNKFFYDSYKLRAVRSVVRIPEGTRIFLSSPKHPNWLWDPPTRPAVKLVPGLFPGAKAAGLSCRPVISNQYRGYE